MTMMATTPATTNQNQSGVAKRSRSANSPIEFGSGLRRNQRNLRQMSGSSVVRVASGTAPGVMSAFAARNPTTRATNSTPMCAVIHNASRRVVVPSRSNKTATSGTTANSALV